MQVKAQVVVNGVAQTIFIDPNKDWIAIRFTKEELRLLHTYTDQDVFIAAPFHQLRSNLKAVHAWAAEWRQRFFSGSHRAPEGALLLPDNSVKNQDGN